MSGNVDLPEPQCEVCKQEVAVHLCYCAFPTRLFCSSCGKKHEDEDFLSTHNRFTVKAFPYFTNLEYLNSLTRRQLRVKQAKAKLDETKQRLDQAKREITDHFDQLISALVKCKEEKLLEARSRDFDQEIEAALKEVGQHIYENSYQSQHWLTTIVWNYDSQHPFELQNFTFTCDENILETVLEGVRHSVSWRLRKGKLEKCASCFKPTSENQVYTGRCPDHEDFVCYSCIQHEGMIHCPACRREHGTHELELLRALIQSAGA